MDNLDYYVEMAAGGDRQAFEELYRRTYYVVYYTCISFLKNEQDALDVTQDVYVTVMNHIQTLSDVSKFMPWLNRIAVNKCKDFLKKNRPALMDEEIMENVPLEENESFLPEEYALNQEKRRIVLNIMSTVLSDKEYQTIIMYYFNGLSVQEIAEVMECPQGTVTYRLSAARGKIKQGVLSYEKKTGDKLYSFAAIPFLASLFASEVSAISGISIAPQAVYATAEMRTDSTGMHAEANSVGMNAETNSVGMNAEAGGTGAINHAGAMMNLTKGGLGVMKTKIIAGIVAAVIVVGGTAAVIINNGKKDDSNKNKKENTENTTEVFAENDNTEDEFKDTEYDENEQDTTVENTENADNQDTEEPEDDNSKYEQQADAIINNADRLFTAFKNGDIDTIMTFCTEDSDVYEELEDMKDKAAVGEVMKVLFADLDWTYPEECREDLIWNLENMDSEDEDSEFSFDVCLTDHCHLYLDDFYFASFPEGTTFPEDYVPETEDEAKDILKQMLNVTPIVYDDSMFITDVNEDGTFKTDIDEILFMERIVWKDLTRAKDTDAFRIFVSETLDVSCDIVIDSQGSSYKEDDESKKAAEALLLDKKMTEVDAMYNTLAGEPIPSNVQYADLTAEQQKRVEEIYTNDVKVYRNNVSHVSTKEKYGSIMYTYPVKYFGSCAEEIKPWLAEKKAMVIDINYDNLGDAKGLVYTFIHNYGRIMEYVSKEGQ